MTAAAMVRQARFAARLTQRQLAARSGIPQPAIARLERGRSSARLETLDRLLRACGKGLEVVDRPGRGVDRTLVLERLQMSPRDRVVATALAWERTRTFAGPRA